MMGAIYEKCSHCTIWLGESLGTSNYAPSDILADYPTSDMGSATTSRIRELLGVLSIDKHLPEPPCFLAISTRLTSKLWPSSLTFHGGDRSRSFES